VPGNSYFLDELDYLREMRRRAAREHWDMARFLAAEGSDPDVERLFEGFAFLTGRLREKLDDEFPEIIHSLLGMWWPHYLRPLPAMAILRFDPVINAFSDSRIVPAGTEIQSKRVDDSRCLFRTAHDVVLHPLTLEEVRLDEQRGHASLEVSFAIWPNATFSETQRGLRLYLNDQLERASDLYRFLLAHTRGIEAVILSNGTEIASVHVPASAIRASESGTILPDTGRVGRGYLALQEYFCFPEQQMFVDVMSFDRIAKAAMEDDADGIKLKFDFDRPLDFSGLREASAVDINCVPIVNIFYGTARPIALKDNRNEYALVVESTAGMRCSLYSVDSCEGYIPGNNEAVVYHRFESFRHQNDPSSRDYYRLRFAQSPQGGNRNPYLSFVKRNRWLDSKSETVSINLTCTNADLPRALDPGDINVSTTSSPEFAKFTNLTRPSRHVPAPLSEHTLWQLVASMAINYASLLESDSLRTVLKTYDFLGTVDTPAGRRTDGILDTLRVESTQPTNRLYQGLPVRGLASTISVAQHAFRSLGRVYAFGRVLDEFLGSFAGVNSFHQLTLKDRDSDEVFQWPAMAGNRSIL
jgi:type VI secretion system protein ImpG